MLLKLIEKCLGLIVLAITGCIIYVIVFAFAYAMTKVRNKDE